MFTDTPALSLLADHRHRELLAEADRFRLAKVAKAARREARAARRHLPVRRTPAPVPAAQTIARRIVDAECRYPVPR